MPDDLATRIRNSTSLTIPGPQRTTLSMLRFYRAPLTFQQRIHHDYGNIVAIGQRNRPRYVFAFGPELNREILTSSDTFEISSALLKVPKHNELGQLFYHNLSLMKGEQHKQHRRLMQPAFHHQQIRYYETSIWHETRHIAKEWEHRSIIDLNLEMKNLTQRIAMKTLFGLTDEKQIEALGKHVHQLTQSILWVTLVPIHFPFTPYWKALKQARIIQTILNSLIEHKRKEVEATDVFASLVQAHDEDGTALTDSELIGHAFTLFVAGHETTANALSWTIFLLQQHPQAMTRVIEEIDGLQTDEDITTYVRSTSTYLERAIKESLRLLPPASIGVRVTHSACQLSNYHIPANTQIFYSPYITHRLPELYEDPHRFKPERWGGIKPSPYEYIPFSAGPHMCIGWSFAMHEMKIVLTILLKRYAFTIQQETPITPNLMMRPVKGMPMRISPQRYSFKRVSVKGTINQLIDWST